MDKRTDIPPRGPQPVANTIPLAQKLLSSTHSEPSFRTGWTRRLYFRLHDRTPMSKYEYECFQGLLKYDFGYFGPPEDFSRDAILDDPEMLLAVRQYFGLEPQP